MNMERRRSGLLLLLIVAMGLSGCVRGLAFRPTVAVVASPTHLPLTVAVAMPVDSRPAEERDGRRAPPTLMLIAAGYTWIRHTGSRLLSDGDLDFDPEETSPSATGLPEVVAGHVLAITRATGVFASAVPLSAPSDSELSGQAQAARNAGSALLLTTEILHCYRGEWARTDATETRTREERRVGNTIEVETRTRRTASRAGTTPIESTVLRFAVYDVRGPHASRIWTRTVTSTAYGVADSAGSALSDALARYAVVLVEMASRAGTP